jgi:hypothetical protein
MQTTLNNTVLTEIERLSAEHNLNREVLCQFAEFVLSQQSVKKSKPIRQKHLKLTDIKEAIFKYFKVQNVPELRKSGTFKMATDGMGKLNLKLTKDWEKLYRELIGVLPGEEKEEGYGCINGVNIFKYDRPWQVFALNPKNASVNDIKQAYRQLSKIYHPDVKETGDAAIFDRLTILYKSISTEV